MRNLLRIFFSPWVIIGALAIAALLTVGIVTWAAMSRSLSPLGSVPAAAITIIPAPTSTDLGVVLPTEIPSPTPETPPSPLPGTIVKGDYVQIVGTGGDGLNLRSAPGLNSEVRYLGFEAEVFEVRDGPQDVDGLTWWYLVGFYDENRNGWAVSNYLDIIQTENPQNDTRPRVR